jgi:hypothetical protein
MIPPTKRMETIHTVTSIAVATPQALARKRKDSEDKENESPLQQGAVANIQQQPWTKECLAQEYRKLLALRVQAAARVAMAAEAHRNAVAASGQVIEQERRILAQVANRSRTAFVAKQQDLQKYINQYNEGRGTVLAAQQQLEAAKMNESKWSVERLCAGIPIDVDEDSDGITLDVVGNFSSKRNTVDYQSSSLEKIRHNMGLTSLEALASLTTNDFIEVIKNLADMGFGFHPHFIALQLRGLLPNKSGNPSFGDIGGSREKLHHRVALLLGFVQE